MNRQEIIEKALKVFENTNIELIQLSQIVNLSNEELELTKTFSEFVSNTQFIPAEKINLEWLGHDNKNQCISLLNKKIIRNFIKDVDFKMTEPLDNKKMFDISFECLKSLLATSKYKGSKNIRSILLKIEELSQILIEVKLKIELRDLNIHIGIYERRITELNESYTNLIQKLQDMEKEIEELKAKQNENLCKKIRRVFGL